LLRGIIKTPFNKGGKSAEQMGDLKLNCPHPRPLSRLEELKGRGELATDSFKWTYKDVLVSTSAGRAGVDLVKGDNKNPL